MLEIEANRVYNPKHAKALCEQLLQLQENKDNKATIGYGKFNLGFCYYELNDINRANQYVLSAIDQLIETEQWQLVARAHNILGIIANTQGNLLLEMDYFIKALHIAKEHHYPDIAYSVTSNIGSVFLFLHDEQNATKYFDRAEQLYPQTSLNAEDRLTNYINQLTAAVRMKKMDKANKYLNLCKDTVGDTKDQFQRITLLSLEAQMAHIQGQYDQRDRLINQIKEISCNQNVIFNAFDDLYTYAELLLEIESYDALWNFINGIEPIVNRTEAYNFQIKIVTLKVKYYEKVGDKKCYMKETSLYFMLSQKINLAQEDIIKDNIDIKFTLEEATKRQKEIEKQNIELQRRSEIDELTQLPNRYLLNEHVDQVFTRMLSKNQNFGYEILDIDQFKEYNDNYGHQAGDQALKSVAMVLKEVTRKEGVFAARYGGDEFVLVYENYNVDQMRMMLEEIAKRVEKLYIIHKYSKVSKQLTISQGAICKLPTSNRKTWDYMAAADRALYEAKGAGKNTYRIITTLQ